MARETHRTHISSRAREQQVFGCVKRGFSTTEIAAALNISESTVKNHVHQVLKKLLVGSRTQAAT
jgi:DNA-binding NarL/FixJ family response regulator